MLEAAKEAEKIAEYQISELLLKKAIQIREEIFGNKHPELAVYYNNLGSLYKRAGAYEKAIFYLETGLKIREEMYGEDSADTANSYNNLGTVYDRIGEKIKHYFITKKH